MYVKKVITFPVICLCCFVLLGFGYKKKDNSKGIKVFFLGHKSKHHDSEKLAGIFTKEFDKDGISITYSSDVGDLREEVLKNYDGLILYANYDTISVSQASSLIDFVKGGKGFIPLHSASFCFRNSPEVVEMIGGQFKSHRVDTFSTVILRPEHPAMKGIQPFTTKDETYVHDKISNKIEVLTERVEGNHHEPYTWVRQYGKGRVFYTAYGHGDATFNNPGFLQLVKSGIRWAAGGN
jgi:uncharacterized protein